MDYPEQILIESPPVARRRLHSADFKARLVALCNDRAVSVAAIARAHNINDNMLHRWIREVHPNKAPVPTASFIAVAMAPDGSTPGSSSVVQLEVISKQCRLNIQWPGHESIACATFVRELLK